LHVAASDSSVKQRSITFALLIQHSPSHDPAAPANIRPCNPMSLLLAPEWGLPLLVEWSM
jgi:hypothetical protein